ncbi:Asp-tRNA(Asn)/Glu-tRNA(Gln) amidotransferase subunit GatC [Candidatus Babeliales bacterium]|nr:Asp-tRNA(Asn)/Glu-tRNA(Gln) amidotransferase subunit GatC [Candidatus Babeliales bacterium]
MVNFEKAELLKIAKLSGVTLNDEEIDTFREQLEAVINYTTELDKISEHEIVEAKRKLNVFRDDKVIPKNPDEVLEQAPEQENHYFVVPKIL